MIWWLFRARNRFKKSFRKLHPHIQKKAVEKSAIFTDIGTHDIYK